MILARKAILFSLIITAVVFSAVAFKHKRNSRETPKVQRHKRGLWDTVSCALWADCPPPPPKCNGKTTNDGGCDAYYSYSWLRDTNGNAVTSIDGSCNSNNACSCPDDGFYSAGATCNLCTEIANCDFGTCASSTDQTCSRCKGQVMDMRGWRAYTKSADSRTCDQACSWRTDSSFCYPGDCSNELRTSCVCTAGFTGQHCTEITAVPMISYNELKLAQGAVNVFAPPNLNAAPSAVQNNIWTNQVSPDSLYFDHRSQFKTTLPTLHPFIESASVGVSDAMAVLKLFNKAGSQKGGTITKGCPGISQDSPNTNLATCAETLPQSSFSSSLPVPFAHEDWLEFTFTSYAGGNVVVVNKETGTKSTNYFAKSNTVHGFELHFDVVDPYHCLTSCAVSMLNTEELITTSTLSITWDGWADDAARLDKYSYQVYSLSDINGVLRKGRVDVSSTVLVNTASGTKTFALTGSPGMYSVHLSAHDRAGNLKTTRRIVLYDDGSTITAAPDATAPLRVTSASPVVQWMWQITEGDVTVTWDQRYKNVFHDTIKALAAVAAEADVENAYDDLLGTRTISAINNVHGIINFTTAWSVDQLGGSTLTLPADASFTQEPDLSATKTIAANLLDGDTFRLWVRAHDIRGYYLPMTYLEESVTVHVDSSPPIIQNLWLTKGHILNISVHGIEDLSKMTVEWEAFDLHSGLREVQWRVYDDFLGQDVVHGHQFVINQGGHVDLAACEASWGSYIRGAMCYCTGPVGCFHQHFQVKPTIVDSAVNSHGGIFHDKNTPVHDYDYWLEVTAWNNANLSTTFRKWITVDLSPPETGAVHDGLSGSPEVDFQSGTDLNAHWSGFFDRESGVKYYQVAFDTQCLDAAVFGNDTVDARVVRTYEEYASWTAPGDGTYYATVVAINAAFEISDPVCSDGVLVDSVAPSLANFYVARAHIEGGVVLAPSGDVWILDSDRRKRRVEAPDAACVSAAGGVSGVNLDLYAESPMPAPRNLSQDCTRGALAAAFIHAFYLSKDNYLFLNWTGSDNSSGVYDYEVGLATTPTASDPDISPYQTTNHHSYYKQHHPALTEGTPFYILVKVIDNAGNEFVQPLGPVEMAWSGPTYTGSVSLTLVPEALVVLWDNSLFTDIQPSLLHFQVALEEQTGGAIIHPPAEPRFVGFCASTVPPTCAAFALTDLHWALHEKHVYVAKVRVTNLAGNDLELTSDTYTHDTRKARNGSIFDVVPSGEETTLGIQRTEDTDFQMSTSSVEARWAGFDDGTQAVTYSVGLGTSPGAYDVVAATDVGSNTDSQFTGLSLAVETKYYVTVTATTSGGDVTVSSDGVTVIQTGQAESSITVKDGPECPAAPAAWTPEHHADATEVPCEDDASFQTSTDTIQAHWTMTAQQMLRYPDVLYIVQRNVPATAIWNDVTSYTSSARNDEIVAQGVELDPGSEYRVAVKFCVSSACTQPVYSSGITVTNRPLRTGQLDVVHSDSTGVSTLAVTMDKFYDGDMSLRSEAQGAVHGYQWSLAHRMSDGTTPQLTSWTDVTGMSDVGATQTQFTLTLSEALSFHKCLILNIRGVSKVGLVSLATADVLDCEAIDPAPVVARAVMDYVGTTLQGSEGAPVTLGFNDAWNEDDADYTPHSNIISAVWPTLRNSHVTWAVLESQGPDVTSHFLDPARQTLLDPCASPLTVACGDVNTKAYINVEFGGVSGRPLLQEGHHYYVCVHAKAESVVHEKWVEQLFDVFDCSDGVTVDLTSPNAGTVVVDGLSHGLYQTSSSVLTVKWSGFSDVEGLGLVGHHSGILSYDVAIGSVTGGEDLAFFTTVGLVNSYTFHSLHMHPGNVYYVTVKAKDHVGRTTTASSTGFVVDNTGPQRSNVNFRFADSYITSVSTVSLCWNDVFVDKESGIDYYVVTVGSRPGHDDIMNKQVTSEDCGEFITDVSMIDGHAYYVTVGAVNKAGLETIATSKPVVALTTPPSSGSVFDGPPPAPGATPIDVDFVTSPDDVVAFWTGFATDTAPVTSYVVRLGTCPGCGDVLADYDVGLAKVVSWSHVPLRHDIRYYTTVTACNAVDQCSDMTSDGVMIDVTPPVAGSVWDGTGDEDIGFQTYRGFLGAQWRGFSDLGSGLAGFTWRAGTTAGGSDVMSETHVGITFSAFTSGLTAQLPVGQTIFVTVKAKDAAGNVKEVCSNGFQVDTTAPVVATVPELIPGRGTLDHTTIMTRDMIGVRWSLTDLESSIATQHVSITSHLTGQFQSSSLQIPGPVTEHTFTSLSLHDGTKYRVKVTACNLARLCTTGQTAEILHDNSPPTTGMYAIYTDHAASLGRHTGAAMTWTASFVSLAWLGFHDKHSGIARYLVSVGTQPYGHNLNQAGAPVVVTHSESGSIYEDEGYVQVYDVPTSGLSAGQEIFITVWGVNGVGLKSHPALSQFHLQAGGGLFLKRRCDAFNCQSHCVCSVQGGTCGAATACTEYTDANNPNSLLTILDHADLSVLGSASPPADTYQASLSYLAATWQVSTSQGQQPIRYEVSAGRNNQATPQGVFNLIEDRVWRDVGLETSVVVTVPPDATLTAKIAYSIFVRTWYADGSSAISKSSGITPVVTGPSTSKLVGRAVKEHRTASQDKDVDVVTSSDNVYVTWTDKFVSTSAPVTEHTLYIGTNTEGSDMYSSPVLSGSATSQQATGLSLEETTLYYSTVTAKGGSGILSWSVSDGFVLDTLAPEAGLVMDGLGLEDADYQSSADTVKATWHGFYDAASGVRRYHWCVGTTNDDVTCDVMNWVDVGLLTRKSATLPSPVSQGMTLYSKVYADDMAGHSSPVAVSDGVTVDTTPPTVLSEVFSNGVNLLYNPSFENDVAQNRDLTECDPAPPSSWQLTADSCSTVHRPQHTVSHEGQQHVVMWGTMQQTVTGLTQGAVYRLSLRLANPHNALANQRAVTGHITLGGHVTPFSLDPSMCQGVCDTDVEPVMLWHRFSYVATATSNTLTLYVTTSEASAGQQVAVDDVMLEEIRTVFFAGSDGQTPVASSAVFLPEWSVFHTTWHFQDLVSPIQDYQWALGSSRGGVQVQGFRSVGRRQHASVSGLSLTHGTSLYVTVLARNAAGLTSVLYSEPMTVDMTPPDVTGLKDGDSGDDVDFQTATVISARWSVTDNETDTAHCQWAIGSVPGAGNIQAFQNAVTNTPDQYDVSSDVTSIISGMTLPVTLYVSVRCYNLAGLAGRASTDGVNILATGQTNQMSSLKLLPDSRTQYSVLDSCHVYNNSMRLQWGQATSQIPLKAFQIVRTSAAGEETIMTPSLPFLLEGADVNMTSLSADTSYDVSVNTVDIFGTVTPGVSHTMRVLPDTPTVNPSANLASTVTGRDVTLTWSGLFSSAMTLDYEVTASNMEGSADIALWQKTQNTNLVLDLSLSRKPAFNMSVIITAVDPCGQFVTHTDMVEVVLQ